LEGNKDLYAKNDLTELMKLELHYNSHGGFDTYESEFTRLTDFLEEAGEPVSDSQKKTFFLQGIKDNAYAATKEVAKGKDFKGMVLHLRQKAAEIGKLGENRKIDKRHANQKSNQSKNADSKEKFDDFRLPPETWAKMSREARKNWLDFKKYKLQNPSADEGQEKQYSNDKGNHDLKTTSETEEDQKYQENKVDCKAEESPYASIWKSSRQVKRNLKRAPNHPINFRVFPTVKNDFF
jgi:hypothetical protein